MGFSVFDHPTLPRTGKTVSAPRNVMYSCSTCLYLSLDTGLAHMSLRECLFMCTVAAGIPDEALQRLAPHGTTYSRTLCSLAWNASMMNAIVPKPPRMYSEQLTRTSSFGWDAQHGKCEGCAEDERRVGGARCSRKAPYQVFEPMS